MLSTFLVAHPTAVRVGFWVAVVVLALAAVVLRHQTRVLTVLSGAALAAALVLICWPTAGGLGVRTCTVQLSVPFTGIDTLANVLLLYPATLFLAVRSRRPLLSLVAAALLSVAVETAQALLPSLGRACDTNDVAMNVVGAALAAVVSEAVVRVFCRVPRSRSGVASRA